MKCEWAHIAQITSGIRADSAQIPLRLLRLLRIYLESEQSDRTLLGLPESDQNPLGLLGICSESSRNLLGFRVVQADSEKSKQSPSGVWQSEQSPIDYVGDCKVLFGSALRSNRTQLFVTVSAQHRTRVQASDTRNNPNYESHIQSALAGVENKTYTTFLKATKAWIYILQPSLYKNSLDFTQQYLSI